MGIMVYSLLWVMQDFVHQPYPIVPSLFRGSGESCKSFKSRADLGNTDTLTKSFA